MAADLPPLSRPDLMTVALRLPQAVICLMSALDFHELTTQIPHAVDVAVENQAEGPRLEYPPIRVFWFSGAAWTEGVATYTVDDTPIHMYNPAKSVADVFKYRRQIGLDVAIEALRDCWRERKASMDDLWQYAKVCRVAKVMRPYLESLT